MAAFNAALVNCLKGIEIGVVYYFFVLYYVFIFMFGWESCGLILVAVYIGAEDELRLIRSHEYKYWCQSIKREILRKWISMFLKRIT